MTSRALTPLTAFILSTALVLTAACGGSPEAPAAAPPAPAQAPAASTPATKAATLTLIEPAEGSSSGHVDYFRWSPVDGAEGYRMRLNATADGRVVWESPVVTTAEAHLPNTVALEPEGYLWQVTALKGGTALTESAPSRFSVTP
jgi:hypothetical protein